MTPYRDMALNNAWANATLYAALRRISDEAFQALYPSFFGSIPATLNHILQVDTFYIDAMTGGGLGRTIFDRDDISDIDTLATAQAEQDEQLARFCSKLTEKDLERRCDIERAKGMTRELTGPTLLHLFQHQVHHRGQVHDMMSQAGADPPQLDDFFLEYGRVDTAKAYWNQ